MWVRHSGKYIGGAGGVVGLAVMRACKGVAGFVATLLGLELVEGILEVLLAENLPRVPATPHGDDTVYVGITIYRVASEVSPLADGVVGIDDQVASGLGEVLPDWEPFGARCVAGKVGRLPRGPVGEADDHLSPLALRVKSLAWDFTARVR